MDFQLLRKLGAIAGVGALLFGSQAVHAECASTTFAEEVHYSCSGVLTVMPRRGGEDANAVPERDPSESATESERVDDRPAADEASAGKRGP